MELHSGINNNTIFAYLIKGSYQSGQMGLTVTQLAFAFGGSNPSLPTSNSQTRQAEVAQLIEHQPSKLRVAGLSPVFRSQEEVTPKLLPLFVTTERNMNKQPQYKPNIRDLTQGHILRQLLILSLPLMAISFIQMTYNLVDIIWIGRLGSRSVAAVGSVGMLMWMMNSVALISKIGAEISIGQSIGARRLDHASLYASHTTTIALLLGVIFGTLFILIPQPYVSFYQLEQSISQEAITYLRTIAPGIPVMFLILNFSGIYIGSGRSDIPFYFNASGLLLNILLDPLLIFGLGLFPALGAQGAALATVLSQGIVLLLFIYHLKRKSGLLGRFRFLIKPSKRFTLNILKLGLPVAAMNVYFAFINMNLARTASLYGGHLGITSQTTGGQIEGITWNTSNGFSTALGSFVAQTLLPIKCNVPQKHSATHL